MSFMNSVGQGDVIDVDYQYDDTKAHAAVATGGSMGLMTSGSLGLGLSYSFAPDASGSQKLTGLGFSTQGTFAGSAVTSAFMMDQTAKQSGVDAQNMQLGLKRDQGPFKFNLGFSQVGKDFSQAKSLNLVNGSKAFNFDGSLQLARNGVLSFKNVQNSTPDAKTGVVKDTTSLNGALALALAPGTNFSALHERQTEAQGNDSKLSAVDRLQLDQKMGKNAAATLIQETVTTGKNGDSETVQATRMAANLSGSNGLKVETALAMTDSSKVGAAREAGLKLQQGSQATKFTLALMDRKADSGDLQTHAFGVENTAKSGLRLSASLAGDRGSTSSHENGLIGIENQSNQKFKWGLGLASFGGSEKSGSGTRFNLALNPSKAFSFSGSRSDDRTNKGDASSTKLAMNVAGSNGMKLTGSYNGDDTGAKLTDSTRINFEAAPIDNMKLVASRAEDHNDKGDTSSTKVNVNADASKTVKLGADFSDVNDGKTPKQSSGVNIEAKPNQAFQMAASFTGGSDPTGNNDATKLSVAAGGSTVKVSASMTDANAPTGASSIREAAMSLTPVKDKLSMSGSYRDEQKPTGEVMVATLQADIKPADALAMSGSYKQRDDGSPDQINTVNAQVTLKTTRTLQMIGTYSSNPEEKDQVLRLVRRGLALKTNMGGLSFTGGYTQENSLVNDDAGARAEFTLGLKFNQHAELQGGFEQTVGSVRGYVPKLAYNMKYNHKIGSDFSLDLDAKVSHSKDVALSQADEVKATANLAVRF
jgi:hypothetical protein